MKRRKDRKKDVSRAYASVSVNEIDHPNLYAAIKLGKVEKRVFSSASSFLAKCGEEKLSAMQEPPKDKDGVEVTNTQLLEMLQRVMEMVDRLKCVEVQDDDFNDIRELLDFS